MKSIQEKTEKCAHPPCKCTATIAGEYCGESCRTASGNGETRCKCGHVDCDLLIAIRSAG